MVLNLRAYLHSQLPLILRTCRMVRQPVNFTFSN